MEWKRLCCAAVSTALLTAQLPQAMALSGVSAWAQGEVGKAQLAGLMPENFGTLAAREQITRAEFSAVSVRLFEASTGRVAEVSSERPFTDTEDPVVIAASVLGLVGGRGDGTFDPDATITRQELCVMLGNVLRVAAEEDVANEDILQGFTDSKEVSAWAAKDMAAMVNSGVISGIVQDQGAVTLSPKATATREQSLMMAVRFLEKYELNGEYDDTGMQDPEGTYPVNGPQTPTVPIKPDKSYDLTEEQKVAKVFGNATRGYDSQAEAEANMTEITVPVWRLQSDGSKTAGKMTLTVNRNISELYIAVFEEIYAGSEKFPIKNGGGYAWRSNTRSEHRAGTAVDLNWEENMECNVDEEGNVIKITTGNLWSPGENPYSIPADGDVVRAFKKYGFAWGGDAWKTKRDYMHFSYFGT